MAYHSRVCLEGLRIYTITFIRIPYLRIGSNNELKRARKLKVVAYFTVPSHPLPREAEETIKKLSTSGLLDDSHVI
jgi:hypothetical protein